MFSTHKIPIVLVLPLLTRAALAVGGSPVINPGGILNAASYNLVSTAVAPGSIATIFGSNLSNGTTCYAPCGPKFDKNGVLIPTLAGVGVTFNGVAAPVLVVASSGQIDVQVPVEMAGSSFASVVATVNGQSSAPTSVPITPFAPGIFTANASGSGGGAILNNRDAGLGVVSLALPWFSFPWAHTAQAGDFLQIYATGLGALNPSVPTGKLPTGTTLTANTVSATIGGVAATVSFAGAAGCCVGLNQINLTVPNGVAANPAAPVVLTVSGQSSNIATIAVGGYVGGLGGTLQSMSGSINNSSVSRLGFNLPPGGSATGSISYSGSGSTSGSQTVFALTGSGSGTVSSCLLDGSSSAPGNWSASGTMTITLTAPVPSSGVTDLIGSYSATTGVSACGTTLPTRAVYGGVLGSLAPNGSISLTPIFAGVPGYLGPFNGTADTGVSGLLTTGSILLGISTATGGITITSTLLDTSDTQTTYAVTGSGGGTSGCNPRPGNGNWSASVTSIITLSPPPSSLAATGGSVSGTNSGMNGPATLCGSSLNPIQWRPGTVTGTVFPGGGMALFLSPTAN